MGCCKTHKLLSFHQAYNFFAEKQKFSLQLVISNKDFTTARCLPKSSRMGLVGGTFHRSPMLSVTVHFGVNLCATCEFSWLAIFLFKWLNAIQLFKQNFDSGIWFNMKTRHDTLKINMNFLNINMQCYALDTWIISIEMFTSTLKRKHFIITLTWRERLLYINFYCTFRLALVFFQFHKENQQVHSAVGFWTETKKKKN